MPSRRTSSVAELPDDPVGVAVAGFVGELLGRVAVELRYHPGDQPRPEAPVASGSRVLGTATAQVLDGWWTTLTVWLDERLAPLASSGGPQLSGPLAGLPRAALRAAGAYAGLARPGAPPLAPAVLRALRDTVVVEFLADQHGGGPEHPPTPALLAETLEYLIELGGTRVESRHLTHGVIITDYLTDEPRLAVRYPAGVRAAKRSPLLFDGQRSVLVVDRSGRARTELQRHRLGHLLGQDARRAPWGDEEALDSGSLVALATERMGGIGFFLREDRSIWTFVDGRPLVIRRGEHWTAFPLWLATAIGEAIGGGHAVDLIVGAALLISGQPRGAILGIADDAASLDLVVAAKDRFDRRDDFDPTAMRPETRLHHLIDATDVDPQTLARLAALDGATVVDRQGRLLAYGAIVSSADSQHEGARTAAARTLSTTALVVLKVSEDGEISVLRDGDVVATFLTAGRRR